MSNGLYFQLNHFVDIYERVTAISDAGQKEVTWNPFQLGARCAYLANRTSLNNLNITHVYGHDEILTIVLPAQSHIDYMYRLYNIKDRFGNIIEEGPLEVTSVVHIMGFSGKLHHLEVSGYKVIEQ